MAVNDDIREGLSGYEGFSINTRVKNFLIAQGLGTWKDSLSDMLNKYEYQGKHGWQALIEQFGGADPLAAVIQAAFGNGEQGALFIPKPVINGQQVLFQDYQMTTPTGDGDPIGGMLGSSPNMHQVTQQNSVRRPVLQEPWIEFDGVDDILQSNNATALSFATTSFTLTFAARPNNLSTQSGLITKRGTGSPGAAAGWGLRQMGFNLSYEFDDGTPTGIAGEVLAENVFSVGVAVVITVEFDREQGQVRAYKNGSFVGSKSIAAIGNVGGTRNFSIGSTPNNVYKFNGGLIPGVIYENISSSTRELAEDYIASLAGVTLP